MMKSDMLVIPHAQKVGVRLVLPTKPVASLYMLRQYTYREWNGQYYVQTGWGQDAGWVATEEEAKTACEYVRNHMRFMGVVLVEGLRFPMGSECAICFERQHWYSPNLLRIENETIKVKADEWRFKIVWV